MTLHREVQVRNRARWIEPVLIIGATLLFVTMTLSVFAQILAPDDQWHQVRR